VAHSGVSKIDKGALSKLRSKSGSTNVMNPNVKKQAIIQNVVERLSGG
jgi:hypothetical protein